MMLASCDNCLHRQARACELGLAPDKGELLCKKYSMTVSFRNKIIDVMRKDIQREVSRVTLQVTAERLEGSTAFAG